MVKSRGAKRGRKRKNKRVAVHIKDAAQRRLAENNSNRNSGIKDNTPVIQERRHKRPRENAQKLAEPGRRQRDRTEAEAYLSAWTSFKGAKVKKGVWKFNKNTQAWLLRNMFRLGEVSDSSFAIACRYLDGLKGLARQRVLEQAQAIIEKDGLDEESEQKACDEVSPKASKRVRWDDAAATHPSADKDGADTSASDSDGISSGSDDEEKRAPRKGDKPDPNGDSCSSLDDAIGKEIGKGAKGSRTAKDGREVEGSASSHEASKVDEQNDASITEDKVPLKAQTAVVAYERALQVAELLS